MTFARRKTLPGFKNLDPLAMLHRIRQSAVRTQNTISQVPGFPASQFIILFLVLAGIFLLVVFNLT